jgi:predicted  nucleic acid-binding Zn-ribbon protein
MTQYTEMEMDLMSLTAERDSWRKNFEELKVKYEELQDLFVATDDELNEYRDKFVKEAIQHEYVKNDYDYLSEQLYDIKVRLYKLEQR